MTQAHTSEHSSLSMLDIETLRARGTVKWKAYPEDVLPMWVAETDFDTCPAVVDAIQAAATRQFYGYPTLHSELLAQAVVDYCQKAYGWTITPQQVITSISDVVRGLWLALSHLVDDGPVIVPTPAYPPFLELMRATGRTLVEIPMVETQCHAGIATLGEHARFELDFAAIESAFASGAKALILANPHNPMGTVFTADELVQLTDLAKKYGARILSDEIHAPMVFDGLTHTPTASVSPTAAQVTITVTATSKGWNTAGLKCAQMILTNPSDLEKFRSLPHLLQEGASTLGIAAATAAYTDGLQWLAEEKKYLEENRTFAVEQLGQIPGLKCALPHATFLLWIDLTAVKVPGTDKTFGQLAAEGYSPSKWLVEHAKVALNDGGTFSSPSSRELTQACVRLNYGTSREILQEGVTRIIKALMPA